jgi:hypothetical protein
MLPRTYPGIVCVRAAIVLALLTLPMLGVAQAQAHHHQSQPAGSWHLMHDGVVFLTYNHQGGPRGAERDFPDGGEFGSQNWWMGMAERPLLAGDLRLSLMMSLEPATLGRDGYRQIFQAGETLNDNPMIDRQHPHEFLMQAAAVWSREIGGYRVSAAGAPVGEPALGPVAFMHRASAAENPTAPLTHHTFDSTHITMGVLTGALERGPWQIEGSVFHAREPDEQRWDLMDPGPLDSWAVRGWFRPNDTLTVQISHGFLTDPEPLDPGNIRRTSASASWTRVRERGLSAATIAYGRRNHPGADYNAVLAEGTHDTGTYALYGRVEALQVETDLLRFGTHGFTGGRKDAHVPDGVGGVDVMSVATVGLVRTVTRKWGIDMAVGADVTFHGVPEVLRPTHGDRPVSYHLFLRVRPPTITRMYDMVMTRPLH